MMGPASPHYDAYSRCRLQLQPTAQLPLLPPPKSLCTAACPRFYVSTSKELLRRLQQCKKNALCAIPSPSAHLHAPHPHFCISGPRGQQLAVSRKSKVSYLALVPPCTHQQQPGLQAPDLYSAAVHKEQQ